MTSVGSATALLEYRHDMHKHTIGEIPLVIHEANERMWGILLGTLLLEI
jgi:hypothetical protein